VTQAELTFFAFSGFRKVDCTVVSSSAWSCAHDLGYNVRSNPMVTRPVTVPSITGAATLTLTATYIAGGVISYAYTAGTLMYFDTASNIQAYFGTVYTANDAYEFSIQNYATETTATTSLLLVLLSDASSTVVIASAQTAFIPPGQNRLFLLYRTSSTSTTYTLVQKATWRAYALLAFAGTLVTGGVANSGYFTFTSATATAYTFTSYHYVTGQNINCWDTLVAAAPTVGQSIYAVSGVSISSTTVTAGGFSVYSGANSGTSTTCLFSA